MRKIAVIGGVVIVLAIAISPYYIGKRIENKFENKVTAINNKINEYFHVKDFVKLEYHAGWFHSTAETTLGNKIVIHHTITHGPYCFFGLGRIESKLAIPDKAQQSYQKVKVLFDGQEPYSMITEMSYMGTTYIDFHSPAIGEKTLQEDPTTKIVWDGLNLFFKVSSSKVESSFEMPKLALSDKFGTFMVEGVKSTSKSDRLLDKQLNLVIPETYNLNSSASIDKIKFNMNSLNTGFSNQVFDELEFQLNKLTSQVDIKNNLFNSNFGIDNINASVNKANLSINTINSTSSAEDGLWILKKDLLRPSWATKGITDVKNIKFKETISELGIEFNYHQEQEILDNNNMIGFRELYKATAIDAQSPNYTNFIKEAEFGYKITGLPKKQAATMLTGYEGYLKSILMSLNSDNNSIDKIKYEQVERLAQSASDLGIASLKKTPSIEVHMKLQSYQQGEANVNFSVSLINPDNTTDVQQLLKNVFSRLNAKLTIEIPKSMLAADILNLNNASEEKLAKFEHQIAQQYPSVIKANEYNAVIELKNGQIYLNGELNEELTQKFLSSWH